jgi:hypothetical protein
LELSVGGKESHVSTKNNILLEASKILPSNSPFYGVKSSDVAVVEMFSEKRERENING